MRFVTGTDEWYGGHTIRVPREHPETGTWAGSRIPPTSRRLSDDEERLNAWIDRHPPDPRDFMWGWRDQTTGRKKRRRTS